MLVLQRIECEVHSLQSISARSTTTGLESTLRNIDLHHGMNAEAQRWHTEPTHFVWAR